MTERERHPPCRAPSPTPRRACTYGEIYFELGRVPCLRRCGTIIPSCLPRMKCMYSVLSCTCLISMARSAFSTLSAKPTHQQEKQQSARNKDRYCVISRNSRGRFARGCGGVQHKERLKAWCSKEPAEEELTRGLNNQHSYVCAIYLLRGSSTKSHGALAFNLIGAGA